MNRSLFLLVLCQGLYLTNNIALMAINGLVGISLAPEPWMATFTVAAYLFGSAASMPVVVRLQHRAGRRRSFQLGALMALIAALICAAGAMIGSFTLLLFGTACAGFFQANAALYRFAAIEVAPNGMKAKAVSWVLAGGLLGGIGGPSLAAMSQHLVSTPFVGTYAMLAALAVASYVLVSSIVFPRPLVAGPYRGRPLGEIVRQPILVTAVVGAAFSFGAMNLMLSSTALAMKMHAHTFSLTTYVLEGHVLGRFIPAFFTGGVIKRRGPPLVMAAGVVLYAVATGVALSGTGVGYFIVAMFLVGTGWNLLYTGGTVLLTQTYKPSEKNRIQGLMDFCVFGVMATTGATSGVMLTVYGWSGIAVTAFGLILAIGLLLLWMWLFRRPLLRVAAVETP